jgi:hypothetical protein
MPQKKNLMAFDGQAEFGRTSLSQPKVYQPVAG